MKTMENWISVNDKLPEITEDGESELVLCMGRKGTHRHEPDCYVRYEIMKFTRLDKPDLKDSRGRDVLFGWSNRWWDTNPDLYDVEYWMPLTRTTKIKQQPESDD